MRAKPRHSSTNESGEHWPGERAPDTGPGQPEQLPLTVAEGREDGLQAVLLHPLEVGPVGLLQPAVVRDVLSLVVDTVQMQGLPLGLGVVINQFREK